MSLFTKLIMTEFMFGTLIWLVGFWEIGESPDRNFRWPAIIIVMASALVTCLVRLHVEF